MAINRKMFTSNKARVMLLATAVVAVGTTTGAILAKNSGEDTKTTQASIQPAEQTAKKEVSAAETAATTPAAPPTTASVQTASSSQATAPAAQTTPPPATPATPQELIFYQLTKNRSNFLYITSATELDNAQQPHGYPVTPESKFGYLVSGSAADSKPLYRLKHVNTGRWLVTQSEAEMNKLLNDASNRFIKEGVLGNIYVVQKPGTQVVNRYTNGAGWKLAWATEHDAMKVQGYALDGFVGYMKPAQ